MCAPPRTMPSRCECCDACGPRVSAVGSMLQTSALLACRLPRGLEHASHVLGRALWHALALTDASPRAPQVCSTSREDKRTGFTVPPQTTRDLLGHPRERERETWRGNVKHEGRGRGENGGAREPSGAPRTCRCPFTHPTGAGIVLPEAPPLDLVPSGLINIRDVDRLPRNEIGTGSECT